MVVTELGIVSEPVKFTQPKKADWPIVVKELAAKGQRTVETIRIECIIAYLSHGVWNVQRSSEVGAFVEHICGNPLHAVADGECPRAAFKRFGIVGNICAIGGVEVHLSETVATRESTTTYCRNVSAYGQRTREPTASFESIIVYRIHGVSNGQVARET